MQYITPHQHAAERIAVHPSRRQHHVEPISAPLHVITVIENPNRYYVRYKLYEAFERMVVDSGAILHTVELALRDRHHEITRPDDPFHIQLRSPSQLWHKENLINIGISRLPADWEYVAWVDADIIFTRPDWVFETLHQLQHYHVVQMWSHAQDLGPQFQPLGSTKSFMFSYSTEPTMPEDPSNYYSGAGRIWHPGYAWAARRSAISDLGGLGDIGILGSSDRHMACALIGRVGASLHMNLHPNYKSYWERWQERAEQYVKRNVGYVPGTILHNFHGAKRNRQYSSRWKILIDNKFDPDVDIKKDPQNVWQLTDHNWKLRDDIRKYFVERNEDSIDL